MCAAFPPGFDTKHNTKKKEQTNTYSLILVADATPPPTTPTSRIVGHIYIYLNIHILIYIYILPFRLQVRCSLAPLLAVPGVPLRAIL